MVNNKPLLEEWRDIPGFPGYQASSLGRVRSLDRVDKLPKGRSRRRKGRVLSANLAGRYATYTPSIDATTVSITGHKLVMLAFVGEPKPGEVVCHYDGDPRNNALTNLRYGTAKENEQDKARHGRRVRGEKSKLAKLTDESVLEIRRLRISGAPLHALASQYGVGKDTISMACLGRTWAHAGGPLAPQDPRGSYPRRNAEPTSQDTTA